MDIERVANDPFEAPEKKVENMLQQSETIGLLEFKKFIDLVDGAKEGLKRLREYLKRPEESLEAIQANLQYLQSLSERDKGQEEEMKGWAELEAQRREIIKDIKDILATFERSLDSSDQGMNDLASSIAKNAGSKTKENLKN